MESDYMEYQLYEIMLLFSVYSILGWIVDGILFALKNGEFEHRGICRGPYVTIFALGALAVICGSEAAESFCPAEAAAYFFLVFALGVFAALFFGFGSYVVCAGISGRKLRGRTGEFTWYMPVLAGLCSLILVCHLNPLMVLLLRRLPWWVQMILLLVYWMNYLPDLVDGFIRLIKIRKSRGKKKSAPESMEKSTF